MKSLQQRLEESKGSSKDKDAVAARLKTRVRQLEEAAQEASREAGEKEARREREYKMMQDVSEWENATNRCIVLLYWSVNDLKRDYADHISWKSSALLVCRLNWSIFMQHSLKLLFCFLSFLDSMTL